MPDTDVEAAPNTNDNQPVAALRVLASGSGGNCSALIMREGSKRRVCLIDLGLSPRRTKRELKQAGLEMDEVEHVFITHFDSDHFNRSWGSYLGGQTTFHVHTSHVSDAKSLGISSSVIDAVGQHTTVGDANVYTTLLAHDDEGVAAFRFEYEGAVVGFATDVGSPTGALIDHMSDSDLLAIESNYCPQLQASSSRPAFLKARIMGGRGHLSNQQCAAITRDAQPRQDVVLLHLSRQCNRPDLARQEHHGAPYRVTVSAQHESTPWISVSPSGNDSPRVQTVTRAAPVQSSMLFSRD